MTIVIDEITVCVEGCVYSTYYTYILDHMASSTPTCTNCFSETNYGVSSCVSTVNTMEQHEGRYTLSAKLNDFTV